MAQHSFALKATYLLIILDLQVMGLAAEFPEMATCYLNPNGCESSEELSQTFMNITVQNGNLLPILKNESEIKCLQFKECILTDLSIGLFQAYVQLETLYLNNNNIKSMGPGVFSGLTTLRSLLVDSNNITEIFPGALNSLTTLKVFSISRNMLTHIEVGSFSGLYNLQNLDLSYNHLTVIDVTALASLKSIEYLAIAYNNLTGITSKNYPVNFEFPKLKKLTLNHNLLVELPLLLIENSTELEFLDMSSNLLTELEFRSFVNPRLGYYRNNRIRIIKEWQNSKDNRTIELGNNNIEEITGEDAKGIERLFLQHNHFKVLRDNMFVQFVNLTFLDLSYNHIVSIEANAFQGLLQLTKLQLSYNKVKELPVGCFYSLSSLLELNLSQNILGTIHYGTFTGLKELQILYLDSNNFTSLFESSFYVLANLLQLDIRNNHLISISISKLKQYLPSLVRLEFNGNKLACDEVLSITRILNNLDISYESSNLFNTSNVFGIACQDVEYNSTPLPAIGTVALEDYRSVSWYLGCLLVVLIIIGIAAVLNIIGMLYWYHRQYYRKRMDEETVMDMKPLNKVTISKADSVDNLYSNID